jgi:hypothetical protein
MKTRNQTINPISRDLTILITMGLAIAIGLVTAGVVLVNQLF